MNVLTIHTMRSLASVLRDMGDLRRADSLYQSAYRVASALYGPDHVETDVAEYVLVMQRQRMGDFATAESHARLGLERSTRHFGRPRVWEWRLMLGQLLLDRGQFVEADRYLAESLREIGELFPGGHQSTGDLLNRLAYLADELKRPNADSLYLAAVAWRKSRSVGTPDFMTDGLHFLAWSMLRHGDSASATDLFHRADSLYAGRLARSHPYFSSTRTGLRAATGGRF
jgi:tetratricopeptide (TPR) repeat protein